MGIRCVVQKMTIKSVSYGGRAVMVPGGGGT